MPVDWQALVEFIHGKDPGLVPSFRGVPRRDIDACEAEYSIRLPSSYVDFLLTMGEDSGGLEPFGPTQVHTFSELLALLPPDGYAGQRFFKVAFESDPMALAVLDTFLDLARSDGQDAPLIRFETGVNAVPEVNDSDHTFGESVTRRVFSRLELNRRSYGAMIFVKSRNPADALAIKKTSTELLAQSGLQLALPDLKRVACLSRDSASALVVVDDETKLVDLQLGADNLGAVEILVEALLAGLPDSELVEPPDRRPQQAGAG
jgi:hypothetical protein